MSKYDMEDFDFDDMELDESSIDICTDIEIKEIIIDVYGKILTLYCVGGDRHKVCYNIPSADKGMLKSSYQDNEHILIPSCLVISNSELFRELNINDCGIHIKEYRDIKIEIEELERLLSINSIERDFVEHLLAFE